MSRIIPIPTTRVGDFFVRQNLVKQVQNDQLGMFRLQTQISTGRRLQLPSDDAPAALRAINLQRLLDRKDQIKTNLESSKFYLSGAETSISSVSQLLANIRGEALGVAGTLSDQEARQTVVQQIDQALQTLVATSNSTLQGRYLFAGSRAQNPPYAFNGKFVEYSGNEQTLRSYVDLERLFDTNVSGMEVFGGLSSQVEGTVDLDPQLTPSTRLSTINGGRGISANAAITITVAESGISQSSIVDLSGAVTVRDVARLIEEHAPGTAGVIVDVTGTGLTVRTTAPTSTIVIGEVAEGRTAHELGLFTAPGSTPTNMITGGALDPAVLKTTRLDDLLGTKAQGLLVSAGVSNDLRITANENGTAFDGVTVNFVGGAVAGSEVASYDGGTKTLTVQIADGISTANQVAAAINAEGTFTAAADYHDASTTTQIGTGAVNVATFSAVTSGGSGTVLDTQSGLRLTSGDSTVTLDVSGAKTVEQLLNLINGAGLGLQAQINASQNGINVRSRLSGADFTIGENGGTTAAQLGIRSYTGATELAAFNRGVGVPTASNPAGDDLVITACDGVQLSINLSGARTVQDVLARINSHPLNNTGTTSVTAQLATTGNGIQLVDSSTGTGTLAVAAAEGSQAAEYLGFIPNSAVTVNGSGAQVLTSEDRHTLEADSVFNTLLRLRAALEKGDVEAIGRAIDGLDTDIGRVNFAAAEIGIRLQNLDVLTTRHQDDNVQLQSALSKEIDVDLVEAISNLTARQFAFEASLRTAASLLQISLLNFI